MPIKCTTVFNPDSISSQSDALLVSLTTQAPRVLDGLEFSTRYHQTTIFQTENVQELLYNSHLEDPGLVCISMATNRMGYLGEENIYYESWKPYRDICPLQSCMKNRNSICRLKVIALQSFYKVLRDYTEQGNYDVCKLYM